MTATKAKPSTKAKRMNKEELIQLVFIFIGHNAEQKFTPMAFGNHSGDTHEVSGWRTLTLKKNNRSTWILIYAEGTEQYKLPKETGETVLKAFHGYHKSIPIEQYKELL